MSSMIYYDTKESVLAKTYSLFLFAVQVFFAYSFCQGITLFYGKTVSISYAVNLVFGVLRDLLNGAVYRGVTGFILGVVYLICLGVLIKNLIRSFSCMKELAFSKHRDLDTKRHAVFVLDDRMASSTATIVFFVVFSSLLKDITYSSKFFLIFFIGIFSILLSRFTYSSLQRLTLVSILLQIVQLIVVSVALVFVLLYAKMPALQNIVSAFEAVSVQEEETDFLLLFFEVVYQAVYAIIALCAARVVSDMSGCIEIVDDGIRTKAKRLLIASFLLPVLSIVFHIVEGGLFEIQAILSLCKPHVSIVAAAASVFLISRFEPPTNKVMWNDPAAQLGTVDKNGVLRINDGVITIQERAYADRRDITEVIIPASVSVVEGNAFNGCGGIVAIHCAAKSEPRSWALSWKNGCYATVYWGSEKAK